MNRRGFLASLAGMAIGTAVAPAFVRAASLMPGRGIIIAQPSMAAALARWDSFADEMVDAYSRAIATGFGGTLRLYAGKPDERGPLLMELPMNSPFVPFENTGIVQRSGHLGFAEYESPQGAVLLPKFKLSSLDLVSGSPIQIVNHPLAKL